MLFTGVSAFPITPMDEDSIDEQAFITLIKRLVDAKVDSIGVLGSTGCYAFLSLEERKHLTRLAVANAEDIPVIVSVGSMRTKDVLHLAQDAQKAGVSGILLAPVNYIPLTEVEVYELYRAVNNVVSIPIIVYDNPGTTHFHFSDELHSRIAQLSNIKSIKIPSIAGDLNDAKTRVSNLRSLIPEDVSIGISGDPGALLGLAAGCDLWYSVVGGLFPYTAKELVNRLENGKLTEAYALSDELKGLWRFFGQYGSLRVVASCANILGLAKYPCIPAPLQSIGGEGRELLNDLLENIDLS